MGFSFVSLFTVSMSGTRFALVRLSLLVMGKMLTRRIGSAGLSVEVDRGDFGTELGLLLQFD